LAVLQSHPIQYHEPFFRALAERPEIDLKIYFCHDLGVKKPIYDEGFGKEIQWDTRILEGYQYEFLKNYSLLPSASGFFGLVNPSIIFKLWQGDYDAVLVSGYVFFSNWLAFLGAWLSRTPIVFRGETNLYAPRAVWKQYIKKILLTLLFKNISAFLYSCQSNKEYYKHYGVPEKKLFFSPCAVDNDFFAGQAAKLKKKINKERSILFVGKLISRKRPMDLLKAYNKFINLKTEKLKNKINLVFIGDGVLQSAMEQYVKENNLRDVYFAGFKNQSEISLYYANADLLVVASELDPSPKVVNEAMNFSLPIIVSDKVGTALDLIKNGENGFIYPVGDIEALAGCLEKTLADKTIFKKMGAQSFNMVSRWNFQEETKGMIQALKNLTIK